MLKTAHSCNSQGENKAFHQIEDILSTICNLFMCTQSRKHGTIFFGSFKQLWIFSWLLQPPSCCSNILLMAQISWTQLSLNNLTTKKIDVPLFVVDSLNMCKNVRLVNGNRNISASYDKGHQTNVWISLHKAAGHLTTYYNKTNGLKGRRHFNTAKSTSVQANPPS